MKTKVKLLIIVVVLFFAIIFESAVKSEKTKDVKPRFQHWFLGDIGSNTYVYIIKIDNCQYICVNKGAWDAGSSIIHKEDCNNPLHK